MAVYRPRWQLQLLVPSGSGGYNIPIVVPCSRFCLVRNDHNQADTLEVTADWHYVGSDPRLIESAIGEFFLGEADPVTGEWKIQPSDRKFIGIMVRSKRVNTVGSQMTVEMTFHDYTSVFLACKKYDAAKLVPDYSDDLTSAWARICANTGLINPQNPTEILPLAQQLAQDNPVFVGEAQDVVLGSAVPSRFAKFGKIQVNPKADAWAVWQQCVGMLGLISFMRGDVCIVTTSTDYYTADNPPRFIWGRNVTTFNDERDSTISGKGIVITSFNPLTGTTIEGFYPPVGDATVRRKKVAANKASSINAVLEAEDRVGFAFPGVGTQSAVDAYAKRVYEEYSRQEYEGKLTTSEMAVDRKNGGDQFDLLHLYDGDAIGVEIDKVDYEALGQLESDSAKLDYLVRRAGYDRRLAEVIVTNLNGILSLPAVFLTKRVQIDGETSSETGSFQVEVSFCNRIEIGGGAVSP